MATLKDNDIRPPWNPRRKAHEGRAKGNATMYNSTRWRKLSKLYRMHNPLCVECDKVGIVSPAMHTDHIKPINMGGDAWAWDNLQSLCLRCHSVKSATERADRQVGVGNIP